MAGCQTPAHRIVFDGESTGYTAHALDSRHLSTLHHGEITTGHRGYVQTLRGRVAFVVTGTHGDVVKIKTEEMLRYGDSGAGVVGDCGALLASIEKGAVK